MASVVPSEEAEGAYARAPGVPSDGNKASEPLQAREVAATNEDTEAVRAMLIPMTCVFQGYAAYVVCQRYLKKEMAVGHEGDAERLFTQSTVFMHYGKLVARIGHDIVFACLSTWARCLLAMSLVFVAALVPPVFVWGAGSHWLGWAFIHFGLLGIGVGVFEGTFLSCIKPLGGPTKGWAIMGCPLGLAIVDILGQLLTSHTTLALNPVYIYLYIAICMPLGMFVFASFAPKEGPGHQANFLIALRDGRSWIWKMIPFFIAKVVGNFVMENTPGWFYVYNDDKTNKVPFWNPSATDNLLDRDLYFVLIYIVVLLGDSISRRIPYYGCVKTWLENPDGSSKEGSNRIWLGVAILCSVLGFYLESLAVAAVTLVAAFLAFWGNGLCYGVSAKYIDKDSNVAKEHNRAVYSLWCMIGDVGSIAGAALVDWVNSVFCSQHYPHECVK